MGNFSLQSITFSTTKKIAKKLDHSIFFQFLFDLLIYASEKTFMLVSQVAFPELHFTSCTRYCAGSALGGNFGINNCGKEMQEVGGSRGRS